jgi:uncharacterized protein (TIGR02594 family)
VARISLKEYQQPRPGDPEWLLAAYADLGVAEIPGPRNNPRIMQAYVVCGHPEIKSEETAWCAAKMGQWLSESNLPIPHRSVNLMAGSYETYGSGVPLEEARRGDVCVFYRGSRSNWTRHVMLYLGQTEGSIIGIGGNQSDSVSIITMPKVNLVTRGIRRPVPATKEGLREAGSSEIIAADKIKKLAVGATVASGGLEAVQTVIASPVANPTLTDNLKTSAEQLSLGQTIVESGHAIANLVVGNPWIGFVVVAATGLFVFANRLQADRIVRAWLGHPLSSEAAGPEPTTDPAQP